MQNNSKNSRLGSLQMKILYLLMMQIFLQCFFHVSAHRNARVYKRFLELLRLFYYVHDSIKDKVGGKIFNKQFFFFYFSIPLIEA